METIQYTCAIFFVYNDLAKIIDEIKEALLNKFFVFY